MTSPPRSISGIREKLRAGNVSIGSWMQIVDGSIAEIMGDVGFDWVAIDLEHGNFSDCNLPDVTRALELSGCVPLVRVAEANKIMCKRALDLGAQGLILPNIASPKELVDIVSACQYPPTGQRGVGFSRANLFGAKFDAYREFAQNPLIVPMIENKDALENIEQICQVPNIDAVFVGPYDLSASLSVLGEFDSPIFSKAISKVISTAQRFNIAVGIHCVDPDTALLDRYQEKGFTLIAFSIDSVILRHGASLGVAKFK